jgi:hypothetical protein
MQGTASIDLDPNEIAAITEPRDACERALTGGKAIGGMPG